ncbi:IS630 family transposase, partial [Photorhabdus luminescens]
RVRDWLACHPKFNLLFLPVYSPWLNKIERLWQSLHETVTRNHGCQYMWQLLEKVKTFLNSCPYRNSRE